LKYNLGENEIILLQSLLTQDYFENLVYDPINPYIKYNTYDTAQPNKSQRYSNNIDLIGLEGSLADCPPELKNPKLLPSKWDIFPSKSQLWEYVIHPRICSFNIIKILLRLDDKNSKITVQEIKMILIGEYNKLFTENKDNVIKILNEQGKKLWFGEKGPLRTGDKSIDEIIMDDQYYITNLDLWVLIVYFNLPVVLFTSTTFIENCLKILVANSDKSGKYYFIKCPGRGPRADHVPKYKIVKESDGTSKIPLLDIKLKNPKNKKSVPGREEIQAQAERGIKENILLDYIHNFRPADCKKKNPEKKRDTIRMSKPIN